MLNLRCMIDYKLRYFCQLFIEYYLPPFYKYKNKIKIKINYFTHKMSFLLPVAPLIIGSATSGTVSNWFNNNNNR